MADFFGFIQKTHIYKKYSLLFFGFFPGSCKSKKKPVQNLHRPFSKVVESLCL